MKYLALLALAFAGDQDDNDDGPILPDAIAKFRALPSTADKPLVAFVYSDTCQICKRTAPAVWSVFLKYAGRMDFVMYEVNKHNKPDPAVGAKFGEEHHHLIVEPPATQAAPEGEQPENPERGGGRLEIKEEKKYEEFLTEVDKAYETWLSQKVRRALETWRRQQRGREEAEGRGAGRVPRGGFGGRNDPTGGAASRMLEDPFKDITDPLATTEILGGLAEVEDQPTEPLNAVNRLTGFKLTATSSDWKEKRGDLLAQWTEAWNKKRVATEEAAGHEAVRERTKAIAEKHRTVARSAHLELMRLSGKDFIFDHGGDGEEKKRAQKVWAEWYATAKKTLAWDDVTNAFARQ